jgi:hypothetical protein
MNVDGEQEMWRAVLERLVLDAIKPAPLTPTQAFHQLRALLYFERRHEDFDLVAEFAGYEPGPLLEQINERINQCEPS